MGTVPMWVPPTGPSFVERVASVNRVGSALTVMTGCQKASLLLIRSSHLPPALCGKCYVRTIPGVDGRSC